MAIRVRTSKANNALDLVTNDDDWILGMGDADGGSNVFNHSVDIKPGLSVLGTSTDLLDGAASPASTSNMIPAVSLATDPIVAHELKLPGFDIVQPPAPITNAPTDSINEGNLEELLDHLNRGGQQWTPGSELRIGFPQSYEDIPEYFRQLDGINDYYEAAFEGLSFFSPAQQALVMQALATWADLANITFTIVDPGEEADIYFYAKDLANTAADAKSSGINETHGSRIVVDNDSMVDLAPGSAGFHLLVHEAGHSLGLTHPGIYDAADFGPDEELPPDEYVPGSEYIEDTVMYTVMSYNLASLTGGSDPWVLTPRTHDIYVMQQLYGVNWDTRSANSTYGYNASGVGELYDFTNYGGDIPALTIWDGGGIDTLDLSGDGSGVTLDLRPGAFSSTHGMTYNLSLAYVPDNAPDDFAGYIENAKGGSGNNSIRGNDRDNVLHGNGGHDILVGDDGDDELHGGNGNDRLVGGFGTDTFWGGDGIDTIDYSYSQGSWTVDLSAVLDDPNDLGVMGNANAGGGTEDIYDVEDVIMGSGNDHVTGSSLDNLIVGNGGNDTLIGLAGDDELDGGHGDDTLDGGDHVDRLYGGAGNDTLIGGNSTDYLYGGEHDDDIDGGDGSDEIHGDAGDDDIVGGAGNDTIFGGDGIDIIDGGAHNDTIDGGDGSDTISGGLGVDDLDGGAGSDTADYEFSASDWTIDLISETASTGALVKSLRNFESVRMGSGDDLVLGTTDANNLYGGFGKDVLFGLAGNDWLDGQDQDDVLNGGAGNDFILGGSGNDFASYAWDSAGVAVNLGIVGVQNTIGSGNDLLEDVEGLIGSNFDDVLIGNGESNQLYGRFGNDQISGGDGADLLFGEAGNDNLFGGNGNDVLNGGAGDDWASYLFQDAGVVINLNTEESQNTFGAGFDILIDIENVAATVYADWLTGNAQNNRLEGYGGNDALYGGDGSDALIGGNGNDSLNGGLGNDVLEGGAGTDWALYNSGGLAAGVTIDLNVETQNTGGAGIDTLREMENVWATNFTDSITGDGNANHLRGEGGSDWLWGNGGADTIDGGAGADAIAGGSGADILIGGSGNDHMWGGSGADHFKFSSGWGDDWVWDFQLGSDKLDMSAVVGLNHLLQVDIDNTADGALVTYGTSSVLLIGVDAVSLANNSNFIF